MSTKNRSLKLILLVTFFGCILVTLLNHFFSIILPKDTVISKLFEAKTITIVPHGSVLNLGILEIGFSFIFDIGFLSILGVLVSWYFLRYFR